MVERDLIREIWNQFTFLNAEEKIKLEKHYSTVDSFLSGTIIDFQKLIQRKFPARYSRISRDRIVQKAERTISILSSIGASAISISDDNYPKMLKEIYDPPYILYSRGKRIQAEEDMVAIVGTRRPTGKAVEKSFLFSYELAMQYTSVVSGLAIGIDCSAHRGALRGCGKTIAVLGSGIDQLYPSSNRFLANDILESGGTIVSEYGPGIPPASFRYPARNRIIAGLSSAVIVAEAPSRSGALITADYALNEGRDLFVLNGTEESPGCADLVFNGAKIVSSPADLVSRNPLASSLAVGIKGMKPENHKELSNMMEDEIKNNLVSYRGRFYNNNAD